LLPMHIRHDIPFKSKSKVPKNPILMIEAVTGVGNYKRRTKLEDCL